MPLQYSLREVAEGLSRLRYELIIIWLKRTTNQRALQTYRMTKADLNKHSERLSTD